MIFFLIFLQTLIAISNAYHDNISCGAGYRYVTDEIGSLKINYKGELRFTDIFQCFWSFFTKPGQKIIINITQLSFQPANLIFSPKEGFFVYEASPPEAPHGTGWLTSLPDGQTKTFTSFGYRMFAQLHAPLEAASCDFQATYKAVNAISPNQHDLDICGPQEINVAQANNSWTVPINGKRAQNKQCLWKLISRNSKKVKITFSTVSFYNDNECSINKIEVFDGNSDQSRLLGKICKNEDVRSFVSSGSVLHVKFSAWNISKGEGFKGAYSEIAGSKGQKVTFSAIWILATLLARWWIQ